MLPHRGLVTDALARVEIHIDAAAVAGAHYQAARRLDDDPDGRRAPDGYLRAFCVALGVGQDRLPDAVREMSQLADRASSGQILWSEPAPHAREAIDTLVCAGIAVVVVTNSDGHAAENLREAAICQTTAGAGVTVSAVIDSGSVGSAKPDAGIFRVALERAGVEPTSVAHVGDMVSADIAGARAAAITPIHLDPDRLCRARDHRHIRSLRSIWRHVAPASTVTGGAEPR